MVCKILFLSKFPNIPEKSWRRRWRKPENAKRFAFQANGINELLLKIKELNKILNTTTNWTELNGMKKYMHFWNYVIKSIRRYLLTLSVPEKLKKLIFQIPKIPQTLNITTREAHAQSLSTWISPESLSSTL